MAGMYARNGIGGPVPLSTAESQAQKVPAANAKVTIPENSTGHMFYLPEAGGVNTEWTFSPSANTPTEFTRLLPAAPYRFDFATELGTPMTIHLPGSATGNIYVVID